MTTEAKNQTTKSGQAEQTQVTPLHQWTHDGKRVLIVKCVDKDGKGYQGFQWPTSGPVRPLKCSTAPDCDSGGLFGWAWGLNIGGGKDPDYSGIWIVYAADPAQVILVENEKVKVAADTPENVQAEVLYYGTWAGALEFTRQGRLAWLNHVSEECARRCEGATERSDGTSGASAATGVGGIAALTGELGKIEVGPDALGAVTANEFWWIVRNGAVVACRWQDDKKKWHHLLLVADDLELEDGAEVYVINGNIQK